SSVRPAGDDPSFARTWSAGRLQKESPGACIGLVHKSLNNTPKGLHSHSPGLPGSPGYPGSMKNWMPTLKGLHRALPSLSGRKPDLFVRLLVNVIRTRHSPGLPVGPAPATQPDNPRLTVDYCDTTSSRI